ncbi:MAG: hypothetical protein HY815_19260 [Candidatus Riflebacteria bacterium]|nr:hypothetical protein [Candidatus Riflebacteria bacterium]
MILGMFVAILLLAAPLALLWVVSPAFLTERARGTAVDALCCHRCGRLATLDELEPASVSYPRWNLGVSDDNDRALLCEPCAQATRSLRSVLALCVVGAVAAAHDILFRAGP